MRVLPMYRTGARLLAFGRVTPAKAPVILRFSGRTLSVEHGGQYHRLVTKIPHKTTQDSGRAA